MSFQLWLPSLLVFILAGIGYFVSRRDIVKAARVVRNRKAFVPEVQRVPRENIQSLPSIAGDYWEGDSLKKAVSDLISYAKLFQPDWIAGVNPGGLVLASFVADRLGPPSKKCLLMCQSIEADDIDIVLPAPFKGSNHIDGRILIVDDVSRTGTIFSKIRDFLSSEKGMDQINIEAVRFACLLVVAESTTVRSGFRPDWAYAKTNQRRLMFPWTPVTHPLDIIHDTKMKGIAVSRSNNEEYLSFVNDISIPLTIAKKYME